MTACGKICNLSNWSWTQNLSQEAC